MITKPTRFKGIETVCFKPLIFFYLLQNRPDLRGLKHILQCFHLIQKYHYKTDPI